MGIETAMPCGLIINELASNSIKHAFPQGTGNIKVELESDNGLYVLKVADNGIGLPENTDPKKSKKLGLLVVRTLVNQLNGEMEMTHQRQPNYTSSFRNCFMKNNEKKWVKFILTYF